MAIVLDEMTATLSECSMYNRKELEKHKLCVCMDCLSEYDVCKILDWIDDGRTALYPYCWDDAVVTSTKHTNLYTDEDIYAYKNTVLARRIINEIITFRDDDGEALPIYA